MRSATTIDPIAAARLILADRYRAFTVSTASLFAICQALLDATDNPQPIITNDLAEAARALIAAEATATMAKGPDGYAPLQVGLAREQAFLTFKTLFETEFPE